MPDAGGDPRDELAQAWASAVAGTSYVLLSWDRFHAHLRGLVDQLVPALLDHGPDDAELERTAAAVGERLIEVNLSNPGSLRRTVSVLGPGLLALPELAAVPDLSARVFAVLGALAAGYAEARRERTFAQQEVAKDALIRAKNRSEHLLRTSEARFRALFDSSPMGMAVSDADGHFVEANPAIAEILGHSPEQVARTGWADLFHPDDLAFLRACFQEMLLADMPSKRLQRELIGNHDDRVWVDVVLLLVRAEDGSVQHFVTVVVDLTDQQALHKRLSYQSLHDMLTGLGNRQNADSKLAAVLGRAGQTGEITLLLVDVDGFGLINQGLGYASGDQLLKIVAQHLRESVADENAMVFRVGPDEFAILIENGPDTPDVGTLVDRINQQLAEPTYLDAGRPGAHQGAVSDKVGVAVSVSAGAVRRPARGVSSAELLRQADATLRLAKTTGKRQWATYDADLDRADQQRYALAAGMAGAFENGEISTCYQPVLRMDGTTRPIGLQVVVRWDHAEHGELHHTECLELAELTALSRDLGGWALHTACEQAAGWWRRFGENAPWLGVDLTAQQAQDQDLVAAVMRAFEGTGMPTDRVSLGMPASVLGHRDGVPEDNLRTLASMGIRTCLYDFDPSDIDQAAELGVEAVKFSRQLPAVIPRTGDSAVAKAVAALVPLVRELNIAVVTDGIATREQLNWWQDIGGDYATGPLWPVLGSAEVSSWRDDPA
ncbi:EAL domain-containing protein [Goodfellowiella coeruleoviolacea]|uniref:PAS domain S-box-containing protein/diguanylate cyclase (GGDEF) domain-containing protein n=1 Tax=Goodfellowiella coeruleoviolacea TaxID=334858 RepID=A0AAE3GFB9_9PSEU|nr:EAL domain-containing protein [Goodfellowiella coeruleoviolacea]MCP2166305.1 PAS domain S-box-containing protein/diguanylate cyclase (GGDEF) domain-containing protein [Goodfellowiella coeruleoviolacea]